MRAQYPIHRYSFGHWSLLLSATIFLLALWPRWVGLDGFVTADELRWTCRALNFRAALAAGEWADTLQTGHPGVVPMWLAATTLPATSDTPWARACRELSPSQIAELTPWSVRVALRDLLFAARQPLALAHALLIAAQVPLVIWLWNHRVALLFGALLALDPFHLALSRVLHLDALTAELMALSLLSLLVYEQGRRRPWLLLAGGLAGLAVLTKASALFLSLFTVAWLIGVFVVRRAEPGRSPGRLMADLVLWHAVAGLVFWAAWPAMWGDPVGTTRQVLGQALGYVVEAEKSTSFFLGQRVSEPGALFYPVIALLRATPLTLIGVLLVPLALRRQERRAPLVALIAYAAGFALFLTFSEKKFDRYLLPALQTLTLIAAIGLVTGAEEVVRYMSRQGDKETRGQGNTVSPSSTCLPVSLATYFLVFLSTVLIQVATVFSYHPYYLAYYNPLLGGTGRAPWWTLVGWGEGLDQVAEFLNRQPGAERLRVIGWGATLGPLFEGQVARFQPENLAISDYVVLYVSDVQTGKEQALTGVPVVNHDLPLIFGGKVGEIERPAYVARVHGLDYAWVFANPVRSARPVRARFGERITLLGYELDAEAIAPGETLALTLYWQALGPVETGYTVFTHLMDAQERIWAQHDGLPADGARPTDRWEVGELVVDRHALTVSPEAPPGLYQLEVGLYRADTGARLLALDGDGQPLAGDRVLLCPVTVR